MMRNAAIDFAHREGYQRSPDDVTASRLVGSVLSPALKRAFGDPFTAPFVFRGLFAELGGGLESDLFYSLGFDGEFRLAQRCCVVAGGEAETERAAERLAAGWREGMGLQEGLQLALRGWAAARRAPAADDGSGEAGPEEDVEAVLVRELEAGVLEAGLLERETPRESRFRLLAARELEPVRSELAAAR
jgi:proteasome alpha subunit